MCSICRFSTRIFHIRLFELAPVTSNLPSDVMCNISNMLFSEGRLKELTWCVAVCCRVLPCVAVCCSVLQCVAVCCSVLQCVAVCCSVLQCVLCTT